MFKCIINKLFTFAFEIITVSLLMFIVFMVKSAEASEFKYFTHADLVLGVEYDTTSHTMVCFDKHSNTLSNARHDKFVSNLGFDVGLVRYKSVMFEAYYEHSSCVFGDDLSVDDSVGLKFRIRLWGE